LALAAILAAAASAASAPENPTLQSLPQGAGSIPQAENVEKKPAADALAVSVALDQPGARPYVGEPLALRITLKNSSGAPLMVPQWDLFPDVIAVRVSIVGYPGSTEAKQAEAETVWEGAVFQKADFRPLPPGETVVVRTVTPLVPGRATITVAVNSPTDRYRSLTDGREQTIERGWTGHIYTSMTVEIPAEVSPQMQVRYDQLRRQLADPIVPADQKGRLLAIVGDEQHYFAAKFLREMAEGLPAGPMRDAAVWQLLKLARFGTGYEAIPLLLGKMTDLNTKQDIRVAILDWAAESLREKGRLPIDSQAMYAWPDALLKQARDQVERLTQDANPYFAARAKDALRQLEAPPVK
jgi:hypothetical protein